MSHDVAPQRAVGRQDDVPVGQRPRLFEPCIAGVVEHPQLGREFLRLLDPVEDEALRHDDERRPVGDLPGAGHDLSADEHGEHLDRLAEAHVVGEAAAQAHAFEKGEPAEPLALIMPQRALKSLGLVLGLRPFAAGEFVADLLEGLVDLRPRLSGKQRVEQGHLDASVPQPAIVLRGQRRHRLELRRKALGQNADRAVGQFHRAVTPGDGLEQGRHFGGHAAKIDRARQFEPVNAARHVPGHAPGRSVATARHLHGPAGGRERRHRGVEPGPRNLHVMGDDSGVVVASPRRDHAVARQQRQRVPLGRPVAAPRHSKGDDLGVFERRSSEQLEEFSLFWVRRREASFNHVDTKCVKPLYHPKLLLRRQAHPSATHSVAEGCVVELDRGAH